MKFGKALQVEFKNTSANLDRRQAVNLDNKLANHIILADVGGNSFFLEKYTAMKDWEVLKNVDKIYEDAISKGAIDHHDLDNFFAKANVDSQKSASKMVVDYKKAVLKLIKKYNITHVETHKESDADAIASSYLIQSLIQHGKLPVIAEDLADIVNRLDYGQFDESADVLFRSMIGFLFAVKNIISSRGRKALGKEVFANLELKTNGGRLNKEGRNRLLQISQKYEDLRNQYSFEIINKANEAKKKNPEFSLLMDMTSLMDEFSPELREILELGLDKLRNAVERFEEGFKNAELFKAILKKKNGEDKEVSILLGACSNPVVFTNHAYSRTSPHTVIAVYREEQGFGIEEAGDQYNVGIRVEDVDEVNLIGIWQALNLAEKKKRDEIYSKPEKERSPIEKGYIEKWENQRERKFPGIDESIVLMKDPVALVGGRSYIAAPRTALLSKEEFFEVLKSFKK